MNELKYPASCRRFDVFEIETQGPSGGSPFTDQWIQGIFTCADETVTVRGFYDGEGIYKLRFMPSFSSRYTFVVRASFLSGPYSGTFYAEKQRENNHGPVHVSDTYHFACADGTRYLPIGTTCYAWHLQKEEQIKETLNTLDSSPFNKLRFCIFPKHYAFNFSEPPVYPYEGTPVDSSDINDDNFMEYYGHYEGNHFDHSAFNPAYFRRIESCISELEKRGIEADLILFHPYDRWGFSAMRHEEDILYLNYVINRFSAFHNVWWSLANEWDLLKNKSEADWEDLASVLVRNDPWHHLRSIHNCRTLYNQNAPWITHVSLQRIDLYKGAELTDTYRSLYHKPIVFDELGYEGNLAYGWGNLTAQELTRRAWETALRGGYPGHSETYPANPSSIWWSHGGTLLGESWKRFAFLKKILEDTDGQALAPLQAEWDSIAAIPETEEYNPIKSQYLFYYSFMRPSSRTFDFHNDAAYTVEVIDTWNMTIEEIGVFSGRFTIPLPSKQYMLIRLKLAPVKLKEAALTDPDDSAQISQDIQDEGNETADEYAEISEVSTTAENTSPSPEENDDIVFDGNDLDKTISLEQPEDHDSEIEKTLNIPPVNFHRSINDSIRKENKGVKHN